jgi:tetratricopeptide (TPR) repeat protein
LKVEILQKLERFSDIPNVIFSLAETDPARAMASVPDILAWGDAVSAAQLLVQLALAGHETNPDSGIARALIQALEIDGVKAEQIGDVRAAALIWRTLRALDAENKRARAGLRRLVGPLVAEARSLARAEDFDGAASAFGEAVTLDPSDERVRREYASSLERFEQWDAAATTWESLIDGDSTEALTRGARSARKAGQDARALAIYMRGPADFRSLHESTIESLTRKICRELRDAVTAGDLGNLVSSARLLRSVEGSTTELVESTLRKTVASLLKLMRRPDLEVDRQMDLGRLILSLEPENALASRQLGRLLAAERRFAEAVPVYEQLVKLEPDDTSHRLKLAIAYRALKRYDAAKTALDDLLLAEPGNAKAQGVLEALRARGTSH